MRTQENAPLADARHFAPPIDPVPREGGWIQTFSGGQFWPVDPRAADIFIEDVAASLARLCRYTGHLKLDVENYTVAEHCCRVSDVLARAYPGERRLHLEGLLHDAPEFATNDLNSPLKHDPLLRGYKMAEERVRLAFVERFGLELEEDPRVKVADLILLATEQRDLMAPCEHRWTTPYKPLDAVIVPWSRRRAMSEFLHRFARLMPDLFRCTDCGAKVDAVGGGFIRGQLIGAPSCPTCASPLWVCV
jgi:hypothetical protein